VVQWNALLQHLQHAATLERKQNDAAAEKLMGKPFKYGNFDIISDHFHVFSAISHPARVG